ncbi:hypothetical protein HDU81_005240 [Chytriomyces hyalinus]|nr:hypothetical protein HDU81_005240 [Chytriomyces hyalinus]
MNATTLQELQSVGIAISFKPELLFCTHCKQSINSTSNDAVDAFSKAHISKGCFLPSSVPSLTLADEPRQVEDSAAVHRAAKRNYVARRREEEWNVWNGFQALYQHDRKIVIEVASVLGGFSDDLYQRMLVRVSRNCVGANATSAETAKLQSADAPTLPALPTQASPQLSQAAVTQDTFEYKKKNCVLVSSATSKVLAARKVSMDKRPKEEEEDSVDGIVDIDLEMDDTPNVPAAKRRRSARKIQAKIQQPVKNE